MTSTRGNWLRYVLGGLTVLAVGAPLARAQGPDPFKPYNWMYTPYTNGIGMAGPAGGQSAPLMGRSSMGGPNQFQDYLMEVYGAGRSASQRYGQGMPYYRGAVDLIDRNGTREYQPNRRSEPTFEETMNRVTQKYLAYFSETDPKRRALLLRDYNLSQRKFTRSLTSRRGALRDDLRAAAPDSGAPARSGARPDADVEAARELLRSRTRSSDDASGTSRRDRPTGATSGGRAIPPAPDIGPSTGRRSARQGRTPAEVLERARRFDDGTPSARGSIDRRSSGSRAIPPAPPVDR